MEFEKISAIIAKKMSIDVSSVTMESTLQDLGIDSLDMAELIMDFEDEFGISLDGVTGITNLADMVKIVAERKSNA